MDAALQSPYGARTNGTTEGLQKQGFAKSTLCQSLNGIQETGAIAQTDDGYTTTDDTLRFFLEARTRTTPFETEYRTNGARVVETQKGEIADTQTAFSAFTRYGVGYHPAKTYVY